MPSILITQCLQNDFVKPIADGEPLPNKLHIGHSEARRLIGNRASSGPVNRFMQWIEQTPEIKTIHIRDWHCTADHKQQSHLQQFGPHCLANSEGAQFVFGEIEESHRNLLGVINSTTLNDFDGTQLHVLLEGFSEQHSSSRIKVGIIGVWTEAKILFLAYELATRFPQFELAICSALTASSSRNHHYLAIEQLKRILAVRIIDSVGDFADFLADNAPLLLPLDYSNQLKIKQRTPFPLDTESEQLLRYVFRNCTEISLTLLDGGFSGNTVALADSIDLHGHQLPPTVVKIGPRSAMAQERTSFEQIEQVLANHAPAIADYADLKNLGIIKYRYASMSDEQTRSLQKCIQTEESVAKIKTYLTSLFQHQLGRLYRAATMENKQLLQYYCFSSAWAESVKSKMLDLITFDSHQKTIQIRPGFSSYNLYLFYRDGIEALTDCPADYPWAFVHGDLNGANVIIDELDNVWLIDFFHTHKGHMLKDFAKLENDLLYIYTPINSEQQLQLAMQLSDFLLASDDPLSDVREIPVALQTDAFLRTFAILRHLRKLALNALPTPSMASQWQWLVAQLRYAVHTIGFDEPNLHQRTWALYSSCKIAEKILHLSKSGRVLLEDSRSSTKPVGEPQLDD